MMFPYRSDFRKISRSANPFFEKYASANFAYSSGVMTSTLKIPEPSLARSAGISRAPGTNKDRNRSQSRFLVGGPEITAYVAAMIAPTEETSAEFAAGTAEPCVAGAAAGAALCDFEASCADTADTKHPNKTTPLTPRSTCDMNTLPGLGLLRALRPPQPPHLKPCAG